MDDLARMKELIQTLNEASYAYYQTDKEIMSNYEYDALYDELVMLEEKSGTVLSGSPTQKVGFEVVSLLPKIQHALPMKSLDKTKDVNALSSFLGEQEGLLSWKLDGLTIVLTYDNGLLSLAATRGNGEVGEVITTNARFFDGVPQKISYPGHLVVRGEALISYKEFNRINEGLDPTKQYKNPRNLCSGTVRQLDSRIAAERKVSVVVYTLVETDQDPAIFHDSKEAQLQWLSGLGFTPVEYRKVTGQTVEEAEKNFSDQVDAMPFPVDGLVLTLDSISVSAALGSTAKFPRDSIAFKWQDETAETTLLQIEWSPSRTGLINPVAIFEPVELEGTTVKRASVHNVSILQELKLGIGDRIKVYKANMIIPQILENLTRSGNLTIPAHCPRCGGETKIVQNEDVKELICTNPSCPAKLLKALSHYVSREAMNIDGLSDAILEKMNEQGWLNGFGDLYRLKEHAGEIMQLEGFGEKSCIKLLDAIEESRHRELPRFLSAIGIPGVGIATGRLLAKAMDYDLIRLMEADEEALSMIDGIGPVMGKDISLFFRQEDNQKMIQDLMTYITIERPAKEETSELNGMTFVITGSLNHFENRNELKELLQSKGAKVAGSVSKNTTYLINNDITSTSGKNKEAKKLGIPIISEEELLTTLLVND